MKYKIAILVILTSALVACDSGQSPEMKVLKEKNQALTDLTKQRTVALRQNEQELLIIQNEINSLITDLKHIGEVTGDLNDHEIKEAIEAHIQRKKMLEKELIKKKVKLAEVAASKMQLEEDLQEQAEELIVLLAELENADLAVASQENVIAQLQIENELLRSELNQAFLVMGTKKELKLKGVTKKEGGLFGIGAKRVFNEDIDLSTLSTIDASLKSFFHIPSDQVKLISAHPSASYELIPQEGGIQIKIIEPQELWSTSKVLAIQTL